jgi:predicted phage tail protein
VAVAAPTLQWSAATDDTAVSHYEIQLDDSALFNAPMAMNASAAGTSLTTPDLTPATYFWRVRAVDVNGNLGAFMAPFSFTVATGDVQPPTMSSLLLPPNGHVRLPGAVVTVWSACTDNVGVAGYNLEVYQLNSAGVATPVYANTVAGTTDTTPALPAGVYLWRIRAFDAAGNASLWTAAFAFTLDATATPDATPPTAPVRVSPPNLGPAFFDPRVPLTWTAGADPQSGIAFHRVEVFAPGPVLVETLTAQTSATTSALPDGTYTWRVTAVNGDGLTTASAPPDWTFTVNRALDVTRPSAPTKIAPVDGSSLAPGPMAASWTASVDNGMIAYYEFQFDTDPAFMTPTAISGQRNAVTATLTMDQPGTYFWRVRAVDAAGNVGQWSGVWIFTIGTAAPPPAGGAAGAATPTTSTESGSQGGGGGGGCAFFSLSPPSGPVSPLLLLAMLIGAIALKRRA